MQAAAGILVAGQQLWAEACLLGSLGSALDCRDVQQYLAALAHVRFVGCAVDAALCCGAASAPSMEAELCRALAQCEEAWQQSPSGMCSLSILHGLILCGTEHGDHSCSLQYDFFANTKDSQGGSTGFWHLFGPSGIYRCIMLSLLSHPALS